MIIKHDLRNILGDNTYRSLNSPSEDINNWEVNIVKINEMQYYSRQLYLMVVAELTTKVDTVLFEHLHKSTRHQVK